MFLRRGVIPALRDDFILLFLFVFAVCFSSFAVPLVLGGSQATTMEVLIFQKIRVAGDWPGALGLASIQLASVLVLSSLLRREPGAALSGRMSNAPLLSWKPGVAFALAPVAVLVFGLLDGVVAGARQLFAMEMLLKGFPALLGGSIVVGAGVATLTTAFLLLLAYVGPRGWLRRFLIAYVAPSSVLTGFSLLVLWRDADAIPAFARVIFGVTLVTVPGFYRLQWDATLRSIEGQREMAWLLGAGERLIFKRVVLPQVIRPACFFGGLASLWAWGDFALSSVVAGRTLTLAMLAQSLMESYRLDAATALVWVLLAGGVATFFLFVGVGNVLGSQSES
jgi:thiamine transport system permease protein